jgi:hypothetical protein
MMSNYAKVNSIVRSCKSMDQLKGASKLVNNLYRLERDDSDYFILQCVLGKVQKKIERKAK